MSVPWREEWYRDPWNRIVRRGDGATVVEEFHHHRRETMTLVESAPALYQALEKMIERGVNVHTVAQAEAAMRKARGET